MGVCLSCHRRKRRSSEKRKVDQSGQSVAPLHVNIGECDKALLDQTAFDIPRNLEDKNSVDRASVGASCDSETSSRSSRNPRPPPPRDYSSQQTFLDHLHRLEEKQLCIYKLDTSVFNGPRKRTKSSFNNDTFDSLNQVYNHDCSDFKQALTKSNGQNIISISRSANKTKRDNIINNKCDGFPSDLINAKTSSRDSATMANAISIPFKVIVSGNRRRYTQDGFNLDLTYITDSLIAMGFPAVNLEGVYRNHIDDVFRFLEDKHRDHYKIYNLCSERSYNSSRFHERVSVYAFDDHNPPKIELIQTFCKDVHEWLSTNQSNVAAVHCKAGKGRTGTMICCYMLHSGQFTIAADALHYYGQERTLDSKGVTIPSQRRYVEYYAALLKMLSRPGPAFSLSVANEMSCNAVGGSDVANPNQYNPPALLIVELRMQPPPTLNGGQGMLEFCVSANHSSQKVSLGSHEARKGSPLVLVPLDRCTPLIGDVKVEVYYKPKLTIGKDRVFHFWFNTFFVTKEVHAVREETKDNNGTTVEIYRLTLDKWQLDDAHKDKQNKLYSSDFKVTLVLQRVPQNSAWRLHEPAVRNQIAQQPSPSPSPSSSGGEEEEESADSAEQEEGWDSGETLSPSPSRLRPRRRASLFPPSLSLSLQLPLPPFRRRLSAPDRFLGKPSKR